MVQSIFYPMPSVWRKREKDSTKGVLIFFSVVFYNFLHFVCFPTSCSKCCDKHWKTFHLKKLACSVGILLGQVNVRSSQSFTQPVMFDLEIEASVGGGGRERWIIFTPHPTPLLIFDHCSPLWHKFLSFPSLALLLKSKMAAIVFSKKILSTHLPNLHLLCRLSENQNLYSPKELQNVSCIQFSVRKWWLGS